jgi:soluble lytic murein transglycosylase-like protein
MEWAVGSGYQSRVTRLICRRNLLLYSKAGQIKEVRRNPRLVTFSLDKVYDSLLMQESSKRAGAIGPMTQYGQALGMSQMLPATAADMARQLGVPYREDLLRGKSQEAANYQMKLGKAYFAQGLKKTGNMRDALHYYHGGPNRKIWGSKTRKYADQVLARAGK